ncbi:zinc finger BED domain-containing 1-like protein [Labeo rohita]|uniref:Zinc finger BED domain-containing 1-like protein n=1 Tax=Labeo rohita TaxID=84645 RepID=A0A498LUF8_LABRO|nr:zinc finger BED domain-containing 1-like protein [Labeo rohita]
MYNTVKTSIKMELMNADYFSATTDMWSRVNMIPYMSLTVHYLSMEWTLKSRCLETVFMPENHTSDNISDALRHAFEEWSLDEKKLACITTDNGANIVAAVKKLNWPWLNCFGHNLHLAVTNAMASVKDRTARAMGLCHTLTKLKNTQKDVQQMIQNRIKKIQDIKHSAETQLIKTQKDVQQMIQDKIKKIQDIKNSAEIRKTQLIKTQKDVQQMIQDKIKKIQDIKNSAEIRKMYSFLCTPTNTRKWPEISMKTHGSLETLRRVLTQLQDTLNRKISHSVFELKWMQQYAENERIDWFEPKRVTFTEFLNELELWKKKRSDPQTLVDPSDSVSNVSRSSKGSSKSRTSSIMSARVKLAADKAALLARAEALKKKHAFELEKAQLESKMEALALQSEIDAANAKLKVLEISEASSLHSSHSSAKLRDAMNEYADKAEEKSTLIIDSESSPLHFKTIGTIPKTPLQRIVHGNSIRAYC